MADETIRREIAAAEQFVEHAGVPVWEVEPGHAGSRGSGPRERLVPMLGDGWPLLSATVRCVHVADEAIESACQQAAERAAARFKE